MYITIHMMHINSLYFFSVCLFVFYLPFISLLLLLFFSFLNLALAMPFLIRCPSQNSSKPILDGSLELQAFPKMAHKSCFLHVSLELEDGGLSFQQQLNGRFSATKQYIIHYFCRKPFL